MCRQTQRGETFLNKTKGDYICPLCGAALIYSHATNEPKDVPDMKTITDPSNRCEICAARFFGNDTICRECRDSLDAYTKQAAAQPLLIQPGRETAEQMELGE